MTMPSPFEMGRLIGGNIVGAFARNKDKSNLDNILSQAYESQGEEGYNNAMKQILLNVSPQNQKAGLALLENRREQHKVKAGNVIKSKVYKDLGLPEGIENLDPKIQELIVANKFSKEKKQPDSIYEKGKVKIGLKKYEESVDSLEESTRNLDRINRIEELSKGVRGITGYIGGVVGGAKATELNALGLAAIEPVLKIFNPRGTLAVQKVKMIQKEFAPRATDLDRTIKGKINALKNINELAKKRSKENISLYEKWEGNPPIEELLKFQDESDKIFNNAISKEVIKLYEEDIKKVPQGTILSDPKIIEKIALMANSEKEAIEIAKKLGYEVQ